MKVAIIGGGAAGFFTAISCKTHNPGAEVVILEKSDKLLAKVKISGGGRCNVSHACFHIPTLVKFYPRGEKQLKKAFGFFNTKDTVKWFEERGVLLKTETDNRMFPVTDNSQTIIDCLLNETRRLGIEIRKRSTVSSIQNGSDSFELMVNREPFIADKVVIATGGSPKLEGFNWLRQLGHRIEPPVPSLFTFNMPQESIRSLMGLVADPVTIRIQGTKLESTGPLLVTHWGMSGPAALRLSAFGARILNDLNYQFKVQINWLGSIKEEEARQLLNELSENIGNRKVTNKNPFQLPSRLWMFLLEKVNIDQQVSWNNLGKKNLNRLLNVLLNDVYQVSGKTTFKEEFVTCGGVSLENVSMRTMESNKCPGLYFAGEVLDIDGVTGGFNFQAAWTTGFIAGKLSSHMN
ncbi:NAD(P)/FAD-dependent oxidoreductase [Fulvivirgaceae bacterium BMA10]|uniref:NAD(P)/FAD-dependent oxidoreductase n=1 Tax=Splendidivirga corallicola TaxID=3051826 RepID=A0ABT8KSA0_9BACT|nr:NAD(P)/FAD-dependent oxidoreductase [Fulvivirgaceae bacterium BMA10]